MPEYQRQNDADLNLLTFASVNSLALHRRRGRSTDPPTTQTAAGGALDGHDDSAQGDIDDQSVVFDEVLRLHQSLDTAGIDGVVRQGRDDVDPGTALWLVAAVLVLLVTAGWAWRRRQGAAAETTREARVPRT